MILGIVYCTVTLIMANDFDIQKTFQRQLAAQKFQARWSNSVPNAQAELAHRLTQHYNDLLRQLPNQAKTVAVETQTHYMQELVVELIKIYHVQMRCVQLNDHLSNNAQQEQLEQLANQCKTQVIALTQLMRQWMDYYAAINQTN